MHFSNAEYPHYSDLSVSLSLYCVFSSLPYEEEDDAAKTETEEKKKIKPNGDGESVKEAKHVIEYNISSDLLDDVLDGKFKLHFLMGTCSSVICGNA